MTSHQIKGVLRGGYRRGLDAATGGTPSAALHFRQTSPTAALRPPRSIATPTLALRPFVPQTRGERAEHGASTSPQLGRIGRIGTDDSEVACHARRGRWKVSTWTLRWSVYRPSKRNNWTSMSVHLDVERSRLEHVYVKRVHQHERVEGIKCLLSTVGCGWQATLEFQEKVGHSVRLNARR